MIRDTVWLEQSMVFEAATARAGCGLIPPPGFRSPNSARTRQLRTLARKASSGKHRKPLGGGRAFWETFSRNAMNLEESESDFGDSADLAADLNHVANVIHI